MTSESDNTADRRPPTIELAATEVATSADESAAGAAESADTRAAEDEAASSNASSPTADNQQTTGTSSGRLTSHVPGALIGAFIMAAVLAALWVTDLIPARDGTAGHTLASNSAAPSPPTTPPTSTVPAQTSPTPPDLSARLDKIERAMQAQRGEPALGGRIGGVEAQAKSLGNDVAALQRRVDEIAASGQSAAKQADTAFNAAEAAKSASEAANKMEVQRGDFDALASRIMALESAVKGLAAATAPVDRAARLTVAAEALRAAVERGAPYQAELTALRALGVDQKAAAPLELFAANGVPSAAALAHELEALTPVLQQASEPDSGDATFLERLKANAEKLVRITPAGAPAGNDPAAVVARIRFDATHGDIAAALAAIDALPDSAKSLTAAWSKKAAAREAALAASRQIASDALAALATPAAR